jgi:hypothetical protein
MNTEEEWSASIVLCRIFVIAQDEKRARYRTQPAKCTEIAADIRLQQECPLSYFFALPAGLFLPLAASAFWCSSFRLLLWSCARSLSHL